MMPKPMQPAAPFYTQAQYLALDEAAPEGIRIEFWHGQVFYQGQPYNAHEPIQMMAGGTPEHNQVCTNLLTHLNLALPDGCFVAGSNQRVEVAADNAYTYPDVVVACPPTFIKTTLLNPQLLVEVLSDSTADRDLGTKLDHYLRLPSVLEYWIVSQDQPLIRQYYRGAEDWSLRFYHGLSETVQSVHFDVQLSMTAVYHRVLPKKDAKNDQ